jgi:hypothetical protein
VHSKLAGTWKEQRGHDNFWLLGIFWTKTAIRDLSPGAEKQHVLAFNTDGSINWKQSDVGLLSQEWQLCEPGDRTSFDGPGGPVEYLKLEEARCREQHTHIEIVPYGQATKLTGKIVLKASLRAPNELRVTFRVRNPMGIPYHQEYRGRFSRICPSENSP